MGSVLAAHFGCFSGFTLHVEFQTHWVTLDARSRENCDKLPLAPAAEEITLALRTEVFKPARTMRTCLASNADAMTRTVRKISISADPPEDASPRPFSVFAHHANIVLLGDPGAGKTHLFQEAAAATEEALFIKARAFLNTPAERLLGQSLFIDGLDERRAGRGDQNTVDALVGKLFEVNPPKVRLSCRAADWLGESDLAAMAPFFDQHGGACVLHLEALSRVEQVAVLMAHRLGGYDIEGFLDDARERGLGDFLENPQNLIMLWSTVTRGDWPATRKELFERSVSLMLQETNPERSRSGGGIFSAEELRPVAGAICAARLVSDVDAISLTDQEGTADVPGYRSLGLFPPEKVQAVLGRRVFVAGPEPETVDYSHRTTAEYLAAEFLASHVRAGLPFGRVLALMGVDGHPASELRGLHAWLTVFLPEHADGLIEIDPYGVLTYGDAASLSPMSCTVLLRALARLSRTNPWFRSENWRAPPIGALARPEMVSEFRAILNDSDAGFGIRSVVVDALALGMALPEMLPDLEAVLSREASPYAERLGAFLALLRLGDNGRAAIRLVFATRLGNSDSDLRLRASIVQELYGDPYGPNEVIKLVHGTLHQESTLSGIFWTLADALPERDLPTILDGIEPTATPEPGAYRRTWEAGAFYSRVLLRNWVNDREFEPTRVMGWLRKRLALQGGPAESGVSGLREAMRAEPERLRALAEDFFNRVPVDDQRWVALNDFREATLFELSAEALTLIATQAFENAEGGSDRRSFLYQVALSLSYQIPSPKGTAVFQDLFLRAETDDALRDVRDAGVVTNLPLNYFVARSSRALRHEESRANQQQEFDQNIEQIRRGEHLDWLTHLAFIYFNLYNHMDGVIAPRDRIAAWLGEERANPALEGLRAALSCEDLPRFDHAVSLAAAQRRVGWWYAVIAGLSERWAEGHGLSELSDDFLKAMLVFDVANPISTREGGVQRWLIHPWRKALMERRPELVRDAYFAIAQSCLSRDDQFVHGLRELLNEPALGSYKPKIVLDLLREFPNANPLRLGDLLHAVDATSAAYRGFLELAKPIVCRTMEVGERQRDLWLVKAYTLAPAQFEDEVRRRAAERRELVFDLRDSSGFALRSEPDHALPLRMLEFMAQLTGSLYPDTPHRSVGWRGDTTPAGASEHTRALINKISATPSAAATEALERLESEPMLSSYKAHILYALHNQRQRRREKEYDRPDWRQTISALANRAPATVADLHALLVAQLRDLAHYIARDNTNPFKQFWNIDAHTKMVDPRPEEACRDVVIHMLRPKLLPLGVTVEPEAHMVAGRRADISAAMPGRKIPCELKRDYHPEVWRAIEGQLERFYAHVPEAKGFGIYVVFWFGAKRWPRQMPRPPGGMQPPQTAAEMEAMLQALLPEGMRKRLAVIVVDASGDI
jgi:predicted NACHT family NTPase